MLFPKPPNDCRARMVGWGIREGVRVDSPLGEGLVAPPRPGVIATVWYPLVPAP